jgi:uncharacterized protein (DUF1697 family)
MASHIALLRGINVGGHNRVAMKDLLDLLAALGLAGGRALLQSGNLVFDGGGRSGADLERLLEQETAARLKLRPAYLVRDAAEWERIVARNPFPTWLPATRVISSSCSSRRRPNRGRSPPRKEAIPGEEELCAHGRQLYLHYTPTASAARSSPAP